MSKVTRRSGYVVRTLPRVAGAVCVLVLAACGGGGGGAAAGGGTSTAKAAPTLAVTAGCTTPGKYTFTDAQAHVVVTGGAHKGETYDLNGIAKPGFETRSDRPNNAYDPTAYDGGPWTELTVGSTDGKGLALEIEGLDPCNNDKEGYTAILYGSDDKARFGGPCDVTVEAFNNSGIRGSWDCKQIQQFGFDDNRPDITAHGSFAATGTSA